MASPFTVNPLSLQKVDDDDPKGIQLWRSQVLLLLYQIQQVIQNPGFLSSILNGTYTLNQTGSFIKAQSGVTTNQTIDTMKSAMVFIDYNLTAAIPFTVTLNNVVDGQLVFLDVTNSSGSTQTITLAANTVAPAAITVYTGANIISSGVSIANNVRVNFLGMASASFLRLGGVGQNW